MKVKTDRQNFIKLKLWRAKEWGDGAQNGRLGTTSLWGVGWADIVKTQRMQQQKQKQNPSNLI